MSSPHAGKADQDHTRKKFATYNRYLPAVHAHFYCLGPDKPLEEEGTFSTCVQAHKLATPCAAVIPAGLALRLRPTSPVFQRMPCVSTTQVCEPRGEQRGNAAVTIDSW
jgi:hypothetical protein